MKKWYFRERNYRTLRESVIPIKKAPQKVLFIKWCAILCDYRTKFCEDFKDLGKKLELLEDIQKQNQSELLVI